VAKEIADHEIYSSEDNERCIAQMATALLSQTNWTADEQNAVRKSLNLAESIFKAVKQRSYDVNV
jgi:hypothetical protein